MKPMRTLILATGFLTYLQAGVSQAALTATDGGAPTGAGPTLTFDGPLLTANPVYLISGSPFDGLFIGFGSYFDGQTLDGGFPYSLIGSTAPGKPLSLVIDPDAYALIADDAAFGSSPIMTAGPANFNEPLAILFSVPVPAVQFTLGSLEAIGATTIEAYDANGNSLGSLVNPGTGLWTLGLTDPGGADIAGISIFSSDLGGFAIDNLTVAQGFDLPEPASVLLLAVGAIAIGVSRRRV